MKTRHALFALLMAGTLLALLALRPPAARGQGDEPPARPSPTPAQLPDGLPPLPDASDVEQPDLIVSDIRVTPNPPLVNRPLTVQVTIENVGTAAVADTNNFFVDLYINPETPPRACVPGQHFWSVQGFELRNGSLTLSVSLNPLDDPRAAAFTDVGIVNIWAQVDTAYDYTNNRCGNVVESREDNNLRVTSVDVATRYDLSQTTPEEFQRGFTSALDLTHPLGVLQNGTGWFEEPRFPQPEDPEWTGDSESNFYNPDRHIYADNLPPDFPREELPTWNPPDQENVDVEVGFSPSVLFAAWEDARNGDLYDRDIFFSYSLDNGVSWLEPVRVNQDGEGNGKNQLDPELVVDRVSRRLYIFWEDNRLSGDYDIFFARSLDQGFTWEEPTFADPISGQTLPSNPVSDKEVDPNADQVNVSAEAFFNEGTGQTHLYVAWEDERNGNADIFFDTSDDGGTTWLKTRDADPTTLEGNVHVQPDPTTNAGIFDQRRPHLFLDRPTSGGTINYCVTQVVFITYYDPVTGEIVLETRHYYPENPLPRVFLVWEDERDTLSGSGSTVYYTRGEFNYETPDEPLIFNESPTCENGGPRAPNPKDNLPEYRFEDDHLRVNSTLAASTQREPVGGFSDDGFVSYRFEQAIEVGDETQEFLCEARFRTEEISIAWQDDRDGTYDIWATNVFDDIDFSVTSYAYVFDPDTNLSNPPANLYEDPNVGCLGPLQGGPGQNEAPTRLPEALRVFRNIDRNSPQPFEFFELSAPERDIKISNDLTFEAKPLCRAPDEPTEYDIEPSQQQNPDLAVLPIDPTLIVDSDDDLPPDRKLTISDTLTVSSFWNVWDDTRSLDAVNQDLLLREVRRYDLSRSLSVLNEDGTTIDLQTVQDNVKNQIVLRELDLYADFQPPNAQQFNPAMSFYDVDGNPETQDDFVLYVGWDDNRNANPLIGFEGNKDVFAARLQLDYDLYAGNYGLRPTRSGSFVSAVFDPGEIATWYDIEWWGDISADGVLNLQTRFGLDPNSPEPPQENVEANGWTQWTGIGGTGGFYTAPGQHITGPDGEQFPQSYYIQYRVNFNPAGGGQQGIHCLSEIGLNYEIEEDLIYLPLVLR